MYWIWRIMHRFKQIYSRIWADLHWLWVSRRDSLNSSSMKTQRLIKKVKLVSGKTDRFNTLNIIYIQYVGFHNTCQPKITILSRFTWLNPHALIFFSTENKRRPSLETLTCFSIHRKNTFKLTISMQHQYIY